MTSLPNGISGIPNGWQTYTEEEYKEVRHYELATKEDITNKVVSLSASSTDTQYPSAKAVYSNINNKHSKEYLTFEVLESGTINFTPISGNENII